jgi:ATP-dependent Clp protease ATP-binding subunit ClpB
MKMFINGTDAQFEDLKQRATGACVRFRDAELPPGSSPGRAMVGFEVDASSGSASLLVQRGVRYAGSSRDIAEWLRQGEKVFPSFESLRHWTSTTLAEAFGTETAQEADQPECVRRLQAGQLTNLDAVRGAMTEANGPHYVSEEEMFTKLTAQIRGQDGALRELSRRVSRHWARTSPRRPLTLLAIGTTGIGKTKTAETLPSVLRELDPANGGYAYLRIDCSELREAHRVSQLLGAPQGYVGYTDGAQLIDQLVANSKTIVLFDEIEKAHPDVLKVLMNAIDCGRLSSPTRRGNTRDVDCRRAIFYFTTNLESEGVLNELSDRDGFEKPEIVDQVCRGKLRAAGVAPELVGRINSFLVFRPLASETKAEIVALSVARVAEEYGVRVERVAPELVVALLSLAKADGFGARPLEFLIDDKLGGAFAQAASAKIKSPLEVRGGPPFECLPLSDAADDQRAATPSAAQ